MGLADYLWTTSMPGQLSILATSKADDMAGASFPASYWERKQWKSDSISSPEAFPSEVELTIMNELCDKIMKVSMKTDVRKSQRFHVDHDSFIMLPNVVVQDRRRSQSRSSSCSSSSSLQIPGALVADTVELHTLCLLLGEHITRIAKNATYWSWAVDCFSQLVAIYNVQRSSNLFSDASPKQYILATICLLATFMSRTLSSITTVTTECFDLPALSEDEKNKINAFLSDRVLGYILWLVETEGSDHHISGDCITYILAHINLTSPVLKSFFDQSKREKLFAYPRFQHLRIWRYMWIKVVLERLLFISDQGAAIPGLKDMRTLAIDELVQSTKIEKDSDVRDHAELLFCCSLASRDSFEMNSSVDQAEAFLLGLNNVVNNLLTTQRSALTV